MIKASKSAQTQELMKKLYGRVPAAAPQKSGMPAGPMDQAAAELEGEPVEELDTEGNPIASATPGVEQAGLGGNQPATPVQTSVSALDEIFAAPSKGRVAARRVPRPSR